MNIRTFLLVLGILALVLGGCSKKSNPVTPPFEGDFPPSSEFSVTLYSASSSVAVGDTFQVRVVLYNVSNVSGCAVRISYSSNLTDILTTAKGSSFFPSDSVVSISKIEPDSGRISFGIGYRGATAANAKSGSGVVSILTCRAKTSGTCSFAIDPNTLEITSPDGTLIPNFGALLVENLSVVIH